MKDVHLAGVPHEGTYVAAVSGGVDSTVLLHLLHRQRPTLKVVVAHVEHGIRGEASQADARFVRALARRFGYPFELLEAGLGAEASEERARHVRYEFLRRICNTHQAVGIITAHHQDDVLETIALNVLRGTGWRGLCSLRSTRHTLRPLLHVPKRDIEAYARTHRIAWCHDSTNDSDRYLRNRLRRKIASNLDSPRRARLLELWRAQCELRVEIEREAADVYRRAVIFEHGDWVELSRYFLSMVPPAVCDELLRLAALKVGGRSLLKDQAEHLRIFALTAKPGQRISPGGGLSGRATKRGIVVGQG